MKNIIRFKLALTVLFLFCIMPVTASEVGDSIDTFDNQTVTNTVQLQGRDIITVSNVTITPTGCLLITAPNEIVITSDLNVQLGGMMELNCGRQWPVRYYYDTNGNTVARKKE